MKRNAEKNLSGATSSQLHGNVICETMVNGTSMLRSSIAFLMIAFTLAGCSTFSDAPRSGDPGQAQEDSATSPFPLPGELDDAVAIAAWTPQPQLESQGLSQEPLTHRKFDCDKPGLFPTHPQQTTKIYHRFLFAKFDERKLKRSDRACRMGSTNMASRLTQPCLIADAGEDVVLSDTYMDQCGHKYRGFWQTTFLKKDETIATLFSLGRALIENRRAGYPGAYVVGPTHEVDAMRFIFLTDLFNGDEERIRTNQAESQSSHHYDPTTRLYTPLTTDH